MKAAAANNAKVNQESAATNQRPIRQKQKVKQIGSNVKVQAPDNSMYTPFRQRANNKIQEQPSHQILSASSKSKFNTFELF